MDALGPILALGAFILLAIAAPWGFDSRPGFANSWADVKERWFIHQRNG